MDARLMSCFSLTTTPSCGLTLGDWVPAGLNSFIGDSWDGVLIPTTSTSFGVNCVSSGAQASLLTICLSREVGILAFVGSMLESQIVILVDGTSCVRSGVQFETKLWVGVSWCSNGDGVKFTFVSRMSLEASTMLFAAGVETSDGQKCSPQPGHVTFVVCGILVVGAMPNTSSNKVGLLVASNAKSPNNRSNKTSPCSFRRGIGRSNGNSLCPWRTWKLVSLVITALSLTSSSLLLPCFVAVRVFSWSRSFRSFFFLLFSFFSLSLSLFLSLCFWPLSRSFSFITASTMLLCNLSRSRSLSSLSLSIAFSFRSFSFSLSFSLSLSASFSRFLLARSAALSLESSSDSSE
mmetsp:Transcript_52574/g.93822  ORF Transcript_52574/g.93822 Transcript_52574/m.93822 type:complete len:349 (+) Transcript_52574:1719-2765(+)